MRELGHEAIVANPRRVKLITAGSRKSDRVDAVTLARLGRIDPGLLAPVQHRPEELQAALALVRARHLLVRTRTALINHCRGTAKAFGRPLSRCDAGSFHRRAQKELVPHLQPALHPLMEEIATLTGRIRAMDRSIAEMIDSRFPDVRRLQQVPGVGPLTAVTFVLTLSDAGRFERSRTVGAYLGLTPRRRQSGERDPKLSISREGDTYLRSLLVEAAHYTMSNRGPETELRRWARRQVERSPSARNRVTVAVARRLAVLLHSLWESGEDYRPLTACG